MTLKNRILNLRKKPLLLVLYGIMIASIVLMVVLGFLYNPSNDVNVQFGDIRILYLILAGIAILMFIAQVLSGLSNGSTMFNMADVGLLFVAPISPKKILIYGLLKQMGTTILSAIFIFYQIPNLKRSLDLGFSDIIGLLVIYIIILFFVQLLSMATYILTNGNERKKLIVKGILAFICLVIGACIAYKYFLLDLGLMESIASTTVFLPFQMIPVIGWSIMFFEGIVIGNIAKVAISLLLYGLSGLILIVIIAKQKGDYYEDVLGITQLTYDRLQDAKNGKAVSVTRKVKVKEERSGIKKGKGASTIFYRHMLEKRRSSRFLFFDTYTFFSVAGAGILSYFNKNIYSGYIVLGILLYLQLFLTLGGKLAFELNKPYIYLIPAKSIHKLISASLFNFLKPVFDGVLIFFTVFIFSKISLIETLFLIVSYILGAGIFISYTIICTRVLGGKPSKVLTATFGIFFLFLIFVPTFGASIAAYFMLPEGLKMLTLLPFIFICIVIIVFTFIVCGDIFDKGEFGNGNQ